MKILSVAFLLLISFGCTTISVNKYANLGPTKYSDEIKRLNILIKGPSTPKLERADAHIQLGLLHSSYKNPEKNYHQALIEIDQYLSIDPKGAENFDVINLKNMLQEISEKCKKEIKKKSNKGVNRRQKRLIKKLKAENEILTDKVDSLEKEIRKLKVTIGRLKQVDVELEKKRKIFK